MTPQHDPHRQGYGWKHPLLGGLGVVIAVGIIAFIDDLTTRVWLIGSFGSSAAMIFGFPDSAFVQPRNVIVGHISAAAVGWLASDLSDGVTGQVVKIQGGVCQIVQGWRPITQITSDKPWTIESIAAGRDALFAKSDPGVPPFLLKMPK